jgi:hypothetical protein
MKNIKLIAAALITSALLGCAHNYEVGVAGIPESERVHVSYGNGVQLVAIDNQPFTSFSGGVLSTNGDTHDISLPKGPHTLKVTYGGGSGMVTVTASGAVELTKELLAGHRYQIVAVPEGQHLRFIITEASSK